MTKTTLTPIDYALIAVIVILLVGFVRLAGRKADTLTDEPKNLKESIPLIQGSFNKSGDIQSTTSGIQNAAPLAPAQLDQLQVSR